MILEAALVVTFSKDSMIMTGADANSGMSKEQDKVNISRLDLSSRQLAPSERYPVAPRVQYWACSCR